MTLLQSALATDVGRVRSSNQDRGLAEKSLCAVADGMGGHQGGEVAASVAIEALRTSFGEGGSVESLLEAVHRANSAVWERASQDSNLRGMGTTLTAVATVTYQEVERLALVNVGDSRTYLLREGHFSQVTADHSLVEEMVRAGELSHEEAAIHPKRHVLTRALGIENQVEVDSWLLPPATGDRLLLCSDGLINEVTDQEMAQALSEEADPQKAAQKLVEMAKAHGGSDNITVVVVDVIEGHGGGDLQSTNDVGSRAHLARATLPPLNRQTDGYTSDPHEQSATDGSSPKGAHAEDGSQQSPVAYGADKRITLRVVLFLILLLAVLGGSVAAVWWYDHNSYFVSLQDGQVVIEQGRPGGLFWLQPNVVTHTGLLAGQVVTYRVSQLKGGVEEPSLGAARRFVSNLKNEYNSLNPALNPSTPPATAVGPNASAPTG